jgi:hypothetical protein
VKRRADLPNGTLKTTLPQTPADSSPATASGPHTCARCRTPPAIPAASPQQRHRQGTRRHIPGTPPHDLIRHRSVRSLFERAHHVEHAIPLARPQVHRKTRIVPDQHIECGGVSTRQIHHVDAIAHTGTIRRLVVAAEHAQLLELAHCQPRDIRHQVVRNAGRIFANQSAFMRAHRIEITQRRDAPARRRHFGIAKKRARPRLRAADSSSQQMPSRFH